MKKIITLIVIITMLATIAAATTIVIKSRTADDDSLFYKSLGDELANAGKAQEAILAYEKSLSLQEDADVLNNLAVLYNQQARYADAITVLSRLAEIDENNPSYHYDLGANLVDKFRNTDDKKLEDLYTALREYENAEKLEPGYEYAAENIAVLKEVLKV